MLTNAAAVTFWFWAWYTYIVVNCALGMKTSFDIKLSQRCLLPHTLLLVTSLHLLLSPALRSLMQSCWSDFVTIQVSKLTPNTVKTTKDWFRARTCHPERCSPTCKSAIRLRELFQSSAFSSTTACVVVLFSFFVSRSVTLSSSPSSSLYHSSSIVFFCNESQRRRMRYTSTANTEL